MRGPGGSAAGATLAAAAEPRRPGRRALLAGVAALALCGSAVFWTTREMARPPHDPSVAGTVPIGQVLAPLAAERESGSGEEVAPFTGFAVSVESDPAGALVTVDGVPRGESPAFAGVDCVPGDRIEVRAEKPGFAPATSETACRADALVKVRLRLARAP